MQFHRSNFFPHSKKVVCPKKNLVSMFEVDRTIPSKSLTFSEMLANITNLTSSEDDEFPKRICITCLNQIRGAFYFKAQAVNSYKELLKQKEIRNLMPAESIKEETSTVNSVFSDIENLPELTLIMAPQTVPIPDGRDENYSEDMLVEVEPPKLQELPEDIPLYAVEEDDEDSDDQEIIDYEPDFSDNDRPEANSNSDEISLPTKDNDVSGKSPDSLADSGINEDGARSIEFNERQIAECQTSDLKQCVCTICDKQMFSFKALLRHKRTYHCENKCNYCRKRCGNGFHLKMHVKTAHRDKFNEFQLNGQTAKVVIESLPVIPECDSCGSKFYHKVALLLHHAECDGKCIECGLKTPQGNLYFLHLEKEHNIKLKKSSNLECPFGCSDDFSSEKVLLEHVQRCHPEDRDEGSTVDTVSEGTESVSNDSFTFQCQHCEARFAKQRSLTSHIGILHKNQEVVPKTQNARKYTREEFIEKFLVTKSNDFKRCIPCKKDIHGKSLSSHLRGKHASLKSYRCELCPEAFFRPDYRMRHMTYSHINEYRCKNCDVHFDRAYKYDAHMVKHGVVAKNFKPDERLDQYDLLTETMKFIEDSTTYDYSKQRVRRMSVFGASTSAGPVEIPLTKDEFVEKYVTNLSEKHSHCTVCQQKMMKSSIITHLFWKHALQKPLKCAFCNERVVKNKLRLSHMSKCHPDEYKCFDCEEQFSKHAQYAEHMLEEHQLKIKTQPSSGEEDDLLLADVRFVSQKNEEEIIEEPEVISMEVETPFSYECRICVKSFSTFRNLKIHNSHKHKEVASSEVADENYSNGPMTFEEFRHNFAENISDSVIKCLVCDQTTKKRNFANHVKSRHATTGAFRCAVCPDAFFRPEHRIQHMSKSHRGMYFCQSCNIQFYRNSRYAKHMKDQHEIEVDFRDNYEVDLNLAELRFVPYVTKTQEEEQNSALPSIIHEPDDDEQEQSSASSTESNEREFTRDEFLATFMKAVNKETRRCTACDKTMLKGSIYNHLMMFHAKTHLFKCPFCDVRLERAPTRIKHLQVFHPDEYKCHDCGLQFQKHAQFVDHMLEEHNFEVTTPKAPGEEKDLSSLDVKYVIQRPSEESNEVDESTSLDSFTFASKRPSRKFSTLMTASDKFLKPKVKEEPKRPEYFMHSIFGNDNSLLEEPPVKAPKTSSTIEYNYGDFKSRFVIDHDSANVKCLPCNKLIIKTSVCAHLRLHHSVVMSYNCELCDEGFQRSDYRMRHMKHVHPNEFKCTYCNTQFYRSTLFREHMKDFHKMNYLVPELKSKEEVDVHLETMKFVEHLSESLKIANMPIRKHGRPRNAAAEPINPNGGGLTFKEFQDLYVEEIGDDLKCMICETIVSRYMMKRHMRRCHATSRSYFCELCDEGFQKLDKRMKHMELVHPNDFQCVHCNVQFYYSQDFVDHMQNTHNVKSCTLRAAKKKSDIDVTIERLRFVPEQLGTDNYEPSANSKHFNLRRPKQTFADIPDDIELTREQFFGKFYRSIKSSPNECKQTKCLACFKVFSSNNRYFHALHNHATSRQWNCEICRKGFFISNKRMRHMKMKHPNDFYCSVCDNQFDRGYIYVDHMMKEHDKLVTIPNVDNDEINVPSHIMRFTKKSTAVRSLKKEQDEAAASMDLLVSSEPKKCSICDLIFNSTREYRMHQRNHSNDGGASFIESIAAAAAADKPWDKPKMEPTFECDLCRKMFLTKNAMNAHKNFKHKLETGCLYRKRKGEKLRFDVECDICTVTSHRRDYIEHHVKTAHKTEFDCPYCYRILSNYNLYMYHVEDTHHSTEKVQRKHVCNVCKKGFRTTDNLTLHKLSKHGEKYKKPERFCDPCGVYYKSDSGYEQHKQNFYHLQISKFVGQQQTSSTRSESVTNIKIKKEPHETVEAVQQNFTDIDKDEDEDDPFTRMMEQKLMPEEPEEPPSKRFKPSESIIDQPQSHGDDDKLDYLQYLQRVDGAFKCGICEKVKRLRKHMLHHLKQHEEIPTYSCNQCDEKFVFKKKYDKHLEMHLKPDLERQEMNVDEHPKFQDVSKDDSNEIKCQTCEMSFKLKIMLNRHNSLWHGDDNPDKMLSMNSQKLKKEELKQELVVIKLLKCKHCLEAFIKPAELKEHLRTKHESLSGDAPELLEDEDEEDEDDPAVTADGNGCFACEKCNLSFNEKKFLENHQLFFCISRQPKTDQVINEQ